jgi:hypothetical protein
MLVLWEYCRLLSDVVPEDGGSVFLRNVGIYLQICMTLQPRGSTLVSLNCRVNLNSHNRLDCIMKIAQLVYVTVLLCQSESEACDRSKIGKVNVLKIINTDLDICNPFPGRCKTFHAGIRVYSVTEVIFNVFTFILINFFNCFELLFSTPYFVFGNILLNIFNFLLSFYKYSFLLVFYS